MSQDIRIYESIQDAYEDNSKMLVTAFVGGEKYGYSAQLTVGGEYICLSQKQILDLIEVLVKRVQSKKGWTATDSDNKLGRVNPDGTVILENDD